MSSLWTPYGEREPERHEPHDTPPAGTEAEEDALRDRTTTDDDAEMREALERLAQTPVADIVANHAIGLWQLAVLHLGLGGGTPPDLAQASLAIDAMGALVDGLGERLGEHTVPLRDAVAQLRLAFVQVSQTVDGPEGSG